MKWLKFTLKFLGYALVFIFALNFVALLLSLFILKGDAWDGKVEGRDYYLGSHRHYTEVSYQVFRFSELLEDGFFTTLPLAFVGVLFLYGADRVERKIRTIHDV
jgi:hypothetical protein